MLDQPLKDWRILVMEDEFLIAIDVEQLCLENGASEVVIYRSVRDYLDENEDTGTFDVAIVDVMLGGDSTLEFARGLRERSLPFIFATGYAETESLFLEFPDVAVVSKPFVAPRLIEALVAAVPRDAAMEQSRSV